MIVCALKKSDKNNLCIRCVNKFFSWTTFLIASKGVRAQISAAARAAGRDPCEVGLVAVSKTQPAERCARPSTRVKRVFGESRAQELVAKAPLLPSVGRAGTSSATCKRTRSARSCRWPNSFHAVDSVELALDINRIAAELGLFPRVLLEVNVSGEPSKFGFSPDAVRARN